MVTTRQLSFTGGEVAPALFGRIDQIKYEQGLRTCRNHMIMRHGGATNRPGTKFVAEVKDSNKKVKLVPFVFSDTQTYALEFGDQYIRVVKNGVQQTVSGVAAWVSGTSYVVGDLVVDVGINYYCITAHTAAPANQPPGVLWHTLTGNIFEIPTPYLEAQLPEIIFAQSADVITLVHPNHAPRELSRTGDTAWVLSVITFAPGISAPTSPAVSGTAGTLNFIYHVTSIASEDFEESLAVLASGVSLKAPTTSQPHTIVWTEEPAAQEYNIYLEVNGIAGFIGVAAGNKFINDGIQPDTIDTAPTARNPFSGAGNFPSTVSYFQQRIVFANTDNKPETVFTSRVGQFGNFTRSSPLQDDDAVTFTLAGREVNEIRHLIELGTLVLFTTGGEWGVRGDEAGVLSPVDINPKQHSYNGSGTLPPLVVGANALYLQARGSVVRDLGFDFQVDGYRGNELSIFAAHLFDRFTLVDWAYQQIPHSIVWAVRSDGALLGLTYVREHQVWAWHRHDTDGLYENITVVPEGNEDVPYVVVNRTINGVTRRYIEQWATRQVDPDNIEDSIFMDSSLSLDGTNTSATTMTLSGVSFLALANLTLTASAGAFVSGDVGNEIHLTGADLATVRVEITVFTSSTVVTVKPVKDVPASLQNTATAVWGKAVDEISGLSHLEGKQVSVFGDGFVVASPNNESHVVLTVSGGSITLAKPRVVLHVGLPYISDLQTLDIDSVQGETLMDKEKLITEVTLFLEDTRGVWGGLKPPTDDTVDPLQKLRELKIRDDEGMDDPVALKTGTAQIQMQGRWNDNGRVFIRQVDPVPISVLAIAPAGMVPFKR